eukprot:83095-Chlamydomonas_euryale.AAC.1
MVVKFDKEVGRCIKAMEELDTAIARKKDVSQQVWVRPWGTGWTEREECCLSEHGDVLSIPKAWGCSEHPQGMGMV